VQSERWTKGVEVEESSKVKEFEVEKKLSRKKDQGIERTYQSSTLVSLRCSSKKRVLRTC